MKFLVSYAFLASAVLAVPTQLAIRNDEDNCEVEYATADSAAQPSVTTSPQAASSSSGSSESSPSSSSTSASSSGSSSSNATSAGASLPSVSSNDTSSALNLPNLPNGEAPIPLNGDYMHAPQENTPVPAGAAIYHPPQSGVFNCADFNKFTVQQRTSNLASKYVKIAPGAYHWALGGVQAASEDSNNRPDENIIIYLFKNGWTFDFRDVTFYIDLTPQTAAQRPHGEMIYVLQSDGVTILGGTIWIDQGELYSQARVTAVDLTKGQASFEVEQGYNVSSWRSAGPRNQGCIDTSNADHYTYVEANFWYVNNYDFSQLDSHKTFTASVSDRAGLAVGQTLYIQTGPSQGGCLTNEDNPGLTVSGMVTNGGFGSIGVEGYPGGNPPHLKNCYSINPPKREGIAARALGPALGFGQIQGVVYNEPGQNSMTYDNAMWQTTGNPKDLKPFNAGRP